jgi:hypothetical protein
MFLTKYYAIDILPPAKPPITYCVFSRKASLFALQNTHSPAFRPWICLQQERHDLSQNQKNPVIRPGFVLQKRWLYIIHWGKEKKEA